MSVTQSLASHVLSGLVRDLQDVVKRCRAAIWKRFQPRTPARSGPRSCELVIGSIDDPELDMRLMSIRGPVTEMSLTALASALTAVDDFTILHLDLTDAEFCDPSGFVHFERLVDGLEDRHVRIRIVGLQPTVSAPFD